VSVRYMLDSDACIYLMKDRSSGLAKRVDRVAQKCALSVIVYGELCLGLERSVRRKEVVRYLEALTDSLRVLPVPIETAASYATVRAHLERTGRVIGSNDLWIAAHALVEGATLVTNNEREFRRVPGLRVENWTR